MATGDRLRVLLLELDAALREVLCVALSEEGIEVSVCACPSELLVQVDGRDNEVALVDLDWFACRQLGQPERIGLRDLRELVSLVVLGSDPASISDGQWDGPGLTVIGKPFDTSALLEAVRHAASRSPETCREPPNGSRRD